MDNSPVLSAGQVSFFKENGYLILENCIEPDLLAAWQEQFWWCLSAKFDDPDSWPTDQTFIGRWRFTPPCPNIGAVPMVQAAVDQLSGGNFIGGGGAPIIKWRNSSGQWSLPRSSHIDGYGPPSQHPEGGLVLGALSNLHDVESKGGCFIYWPGSHLSTYDYFVRHPEQINGSFLDNEGWNYTEFSKGSTEGPTEFYAPAGTVILWHGFMCHNGSPNVNTTPRIGIFGRWHYKKLEEMRYDILDDLWKHWDI